MLKLRTSKLTFPSTKGRLSWSSISWLGLFLFDSTWWCLHTWQALLDQPSPLLVKVAHYYHQYHLLNSCCYFIVASFISIFFTIVNIKIIIFLIIRIIICLIITMLTDANILTFVNMHVSNGSHIGISINIICYFNINFILPKRISIMDISTIDWTIELFAKYPKPGFKPRSFVKKQVSDKKSPSPNIPNIEVGIKLVITPKSTKKKFCLDFAYRVVRASIRRAEQVVSHSRARVA